MKYMITLLMLLIAFSSLEAKQVAIGNTDINNEELCEIFTNKVQDYAIANDGRADSIKRLRYFKSRQEVHCKK